MQTLYGSHIKRRYWNYWKGTKRATKLIVSLKRLPYTERLKQLMLPMLNTWNLQNSSWFYHLEAAVKLNFNTFSTTRGNKYKLQKSSSHYNIGKYSFSSRVQMCGIVCQMTWLRRILLILLRIVLINMCLINMFFLVLTPTQLELEVYRFVCESDVKMRAKRTSTCVPVEDAFDVTQVHYPFSPAAMSESAAASLMANVMFLH